jgi:predicted nucleotidyltransferase
MQEPILGTIEPSMGTSPAPAIGMADALFPRVRQRVLGLLFGTPQRSFYAKEVIALAQSGTGAVQRELADLAAAGILTVHKVGNQTHYQANAQSPIYEELRALVLKTSGLADVLKAALAPLAARIEAAFVFGSVARQQDTAGSDVDLLVVGNELSYAELFGAIEAAAVRLQRKVNPTLYTPADWHARVSEGNSFAVRVMAQPKIWLMGNEETLHAAA